MSLHRHPGGWGYGWRQPRWPSHHHPLYMSHVDAAALLAHTDLAAEFPPPYDQGQEGSCTANAGAGLGQFLLRKLGLPDFTPSRQAIYWWERERDGDIQEDAGSSLATMVEVLGANGCPHEDLWPYTPEDFAAQPPENVVADGLLHLVSGIQQVHQDLNSMKAVLTNGYPIAVGFTVFPSFESGLVTMTGVVPMPGKHERPIGGHAVLVAGNDDATRRFKCRNEWGVDWGMKGYFTIPYAYLTNPRLAGDFWTASEIK